MKYNFYNHKPLLPEEDNREPPRLEDEDVNDNM